MSTKKELIKKCLELGRKPPPLNKGDLEEFLRVLIDTKEDGGIYEEVKTKGETPAYEPEWCILRDEGETWIDHFDKYGWATVPIPDLDVEEYRDKFFDWLELAVYKDGTITSFDRLNPGTWDDLPLNYNGIFRFNGHVPFLWELREKCKPLFQEILEEDDIISSIDGCCFIPEPLKEPKRAKTHWIHSDQPRKYKSFACIQGIVNLNDNGARDGGLFLCENSDKIFKTYLMKYPLEGWGGQFKANIHDRLFDKVRYIKVCAPAGHLIVWDSRIFHCNVPPEVSSSKNINARRYRMCTYVSYQPERKLKEKDWKMRDKAMKELRTTGHWTYGPMAKLNPKSGNTWGKSYPIPPPDDTA